MIFNIKNSLTAVLSCLGMAIFGLRCIDGNATATASKVPENKACKLVMPTLAPAWQSFVTAYDAYFTEGMRLTQSPGAAMVIVRDSQIIWAKGYGVKRANGRDSVDVTTIFRTGSLSKGFAGVLTGMLVADSLLQWDDPVTRYYPAFTLRDAAQARRVKIHHILSHTTGLPYHAYTNLLEDNHEVDAIVKQYFKKAPISGKEGQFFAYQNVAYCTIEPIMLAATGKTYADLLRDRIFKPAHMDRASCHYEGIQDDPNHAWPHLGGGYQWNPDPISNRYYNAIAAGGVNASILDMGAWLKVLLGQYPHIISNTALDQVFKPRISTEKERRIMGGWIKGNNAYYAHGWRILYDGSDTIVYHAGYVNGFRGEIALNRKDGIGICVLFNAASELAPDCIQSFFEQWKAQRAMLMGVQVFKK